MLGGIKARKRTGIYGWMASWTHRSESGVGIPDGGDGQGGSYAYAFNGY